MFLLGVVVAWTVSASAQVLECTSPTGTKEFAQKCPPGTVRQRQMMQGGTPTLDSTTQPTPSASSYKEQEAAFQRRQQEAEAKIAKDKRDEADNYVKCQQALRDIANRPVIGTKDPKTGKWTYQDNPNIPSNVESARAAAQKYCEPDTKLLASPGENAAQTFHRAK